MYPFVVSSLTALFSINCYCSAQRNNAEKSMPKILAKIDENRAVKKPDSVIVAKPSRVGVAPFDPIELPAAFPYKYKKVTDTVASPSLFSNK